MSHLSASAIIKLLSCGESYRRCYVEGERLAGSCATAAGQCFHKVAQMHNEYYIENKKWLSKAVLYEKLFEVMNTEFNSDLKLNPKEAYVGMANLKLAYGKKLKEAIDLLVEHDKQFIPLEAEKKMELNFNVSGQTEAVWFTMDKMLTDGIMDYKTSGMAKTQAKIDNDIAMTIYALAYYATRKELPKQIMYFNIIWGSIFKRQIGGKKPELGDTPVKLAILTTTRTMDDFRCLQRYVSMALELKNKGVYIPASPDSEKCSPPFCGYWQTCRYKSKRVKETQTIDV